MTTQTSNAPITRAGRYFLAPASDSSDCYSAGYEGNVFDSLDEAALAIPGLRNVGPDFDHDWVVSTYPASNLLSLPLVEEETCSDPGRAKTPHFRGHDSTIGRTVQTYTDGSREIIITDEDIAALKQEAIEASDMEQADLCTAAIGGDEDARAQCVEAIRAGQG